jgi:AcrR family transcriptional regulator
VAALVEALGRDPHASLTMSWAAEVTGASAMTIYRYFQGREDLIAALTSQVMRSARADVEPGAPWPDRIRAWMTTVQGLAVRYPQLIELAATGESPAWVPESLFLADILRAAGLSDTSQVAEAVYLIATTSLGQAVLRAAHREMPLPPLHAWISSLPAEEAEAASVLVPHLVGLEEPVWERIVDLTIAEVEARVAAARSRGRSERGSGRGPGRGSAKKR